MDEIVRSTLVAAWRFATAPTRRSLFLENATTDGVVLVPSAFVITTGSPPSMTATQLLVVPRSIPITLLTGSFLHDFLSLLSFHCPSPVQCKTGAHRDRGRIFRIVTTIPLSALFGQAKSQHFHILYSFFRNGFLIKQSKTNRSRLSPLFCRKTLAKMAKQQYTGISQTGISRGNFT